MLIKHMFLMYENILVITYIFVAIQQVYRRNINKINIRNKNIRR